MFSSARADGCSHVGDVAVQTVPRQGVTYTDTQALHVKDDGRWIIRPGALLLAAAGLERLPARVTIR